MSVGDEYNTGYDTAEYICDLTWRVTDKSKNGWLWVILSEVRKSYDCDCDIADCEHTVIHTERDIDTDEEEHYVGFGFRARIREKMDDDDEYSWIEIWNRKRVKRFGCIFACRLLKSES